MNGTKTETIEGPIGICTTYKNGKEFARQMPSFSDAVEEMGVVVNDSNVMSVYLYNRFGDVLKSSENF